MDAPLPPSPVVETLTTVTPIITAPIVDAPLPLVPPVVEMPSSNILRSVVSDMSQSRLVPRPVKQLITTAHSGIPALVTPEFDFGSVMGGADLVSSTVPIEYNLNMLVPSDNPGMKSALTYLMEKEWGSEWLVMGQWMNRGQKWVNEAIDGGFAGSWWAWWQGLRAEEEKMGKGGANIMMLVVLGLAWWGQSIKDIRQRCKGTRTWAAAVCDVKVLGGREEDNEEESSNKEGEEKGDASPPAKAKFKLMVVVRQTAEKGKGGSKKRRRA
ncbi:hypothetical protein DXG01_006844 [Tephrocybe rancida]|nr:hypothetical protein DXG01_006844 [Tephrocybe rancida]